MAGLKRLKPGRWEVLAAGAVLVLALALVFGGSQAGALPGDSPPAQVAAAEGAPGAEEQGAAPPHVPMRDRSFWGRLAGSAWLLLYMILFFLIGLAWGGGPWREDGLDDFRLVGLSGLLGFLLPLLALGAALLASPAAYAGLEPLLLGSPALTLQRFLAHSASRWGSAGLGLAALGAGVSALSLLAAHQAGRIGRVMRPLMELRQAVGQIGMGSSIGLVLDARMLQLRAVGALSRGVLWGVWLGTAVALWRMPGPEPFLFLPDVTVPRLWPPILQTPYLAVGAIVGLILVIGTRVQHPGLRRADPGHWQHMVLQESDYPAWALLTGPLLVSLLVPGGVLVLAAVQNGTLVLMILAVRVLGPAVEPGPEGPAEVLFESGEPAVDLVPVGGSTFLVLGEEGRLAVIAGGERVDSYQLSLGTPLGLAALSEERVCALDRERVLFLRYGDGSLWKESEHHPGSALTSYALNPYGSLLAYGLETKDVAGLFIGDLAEQVLFEGVGTVRDLAFSADGRYLAAVVSTGEVRILDVSTRFPAGTLPSSGAPVERLAAGRAGTWIAACADGSLVSWNGRELHIRELPRGALAVTALAVNPADGRAAAGSDDGHLWVLGADLEEELFGGRVIRGPIRGIVWEDSGTVLVLGRDGVICRVSL